MLRKTVRTLLLIVLCALLASCGSKKKKPSATKTAQSAETQATAQSKPGSDKQTDSSVEELPVETVSSGDVSSESEGSAEKGGNSKSGKPADNSASPGEQKLASTKSAREAEKEEYSAAGSKLDGGVGYLSVGETSAARSNLDVSELPEYPTGGGSATSNQDNSNASNKNESSKAATASGNSKSSGPKYANSATTRKEEEVAHSASGEVSSTASGTKRGMSKEEYAESRRAASQAKSEAKERKAAEAAARKKAEAERKAAQEAEAAAARAEAARIGGLIHTGSAPYASLWGENSTDGTSDIEIIAPRNKDVVVIVREAQNNKVVRHAFVGRGDHHTLTLPAGFYQTFFYYGTHWSARKEVKPGMLGGFRYGEAYDKDKLRKLPAGIVRTYDLTSTEEDTETTPSNAEEMF